MPTLYHGTTADAAAAIRASGQINAGSYYGGVVGVALTPRREMAAEYAGPDGVVFAVTVPVSLLVVDPESYDEMDVAEALRAGASVYYLGDLTLATVEG